MEDRGDVAAREQQRGVGEVDDLGGLEDDDEAERDQGVDGAHGRGRSRSSSAKVRHACGLLSEVGPHDLRVVLDLAGCAVGDPAAEVEYGDGVREPHHHPHVVLDEDDGDAEAVADAGDDGGGPAPFVGGHPGDRLVEQQQLRLHAQGAGEFDELL